MSIKKNPIHKSETSRRILALRKLMDLSQENFAEKLGVGRIAAVYWESGRSKPSAETYIAMAKVAREFDPSSAVWFWEQVGVDRDAIRDLLPEFNRLSEEAEKRVRNATEHAVDGIVRVPLLRKVCDIKAPTFALEDQIEAWIPLPASLVPNPTKICCLWAPEEMRSMGSSSRDILVIDSSDVSPEKLYEEIVIARDQKSGQSYAGFMEPFEMDSRRIRALTGAPPDPEFPYIMRFRDPTKTVWGKFKLGKNQSKEKIASTVLLSPGLIRPMSPEKDWEILGRAICRIGYPKSSLRVLAKGDSK